MAGKLPAIMFILKEQNSHTIPLLDQEDVIIQEVKCLGQREFGSEHFDLDIVVPPQTHTHTHT